MAVVYVGGAVRLDDLRAMLVQNFNSDLAERDGDLEELRMDYVKHNPRCRYGIETCAI